MQILKMDFQSQSTPPVVPVMQSDAQSRFIGIALYDGGAPYAAPENAAYTVQYHGPGPNNMGWYDTITLSSGTRKAVTVDSTNKNIITLELAEQALRVNGNVFINLCVVTSTGYMLHTFPILCRVTGAAYVDPVAVRSFFYVTGITSEQWLAYVTACQDAQKRAEDAAAKFETDPTLSVSGKAADAAKVGEAVGQVKEDIVDMLAPTIINTTTNILNTTGIIGKTFNDISSNDEVYIPIDFSNAEDGTYKLVFAMIDGNTEINPTQGIALNRCKSDKSLYGATYSAEEARDTGIPLDSTIDAYIKITCYYNTTLPITKLGLFIDPTNYEQYKTRTESAALNDINDKLSKIKAEEYSTDILYWGDSLTAHGNGEGTSYADVCSKLMNNAKFINCGVGGETANTIAVRQGGNNFIITNLDVNGNYAKDAFKDIYGSTIIPLRQGDGGNSVNPITVNGQKCQLNINQASWADENYSYTISGYTGDKLLAPNLATMNGNNYTSKIVSIFVGQNGPDDLNERISIIDSMLSKLTHSNYVILGLSTGTNESMNAEDTTMLLKYGNKFFPTRKMLVNYGITYAGLTPTEQDVSEINVGTVPNSLRSDAVHLNENGRKALGTMLAEKMKSLGYDNLIN